MLFHLVAGVVFCSVALVQEPALPDVASNTQPQSGVRAGFWWADYDRDGLDDAFVIGADGAARLLRNSGDGTFVDVTLLAGLDGLGAASFAAWSDYDRDGAPDVFVGTQSGPGRLMRNAGDGTFQDVTQFVGLNHSGRHLAAQWFDYDLDGLVDLSVRTDAGEHLYHSLPNGHFEAVDLGSVKPRPNIDGPVDAPGIDSVASADGSDPVTLGKDKPEGRRPANRPSSDPMNPRAQPTHMSVAPPLTPPGSYLISACPPRITDTGAGGCLQASSVATLGMLFPLTINLNVSGSGDVGIGTTTPAAKLEVVGTARMSDTLTLNASVDQALNVSTGSIYKGGSLFIHSKGGAGNTALGSEALKNVTAGFSNTAIGGAALFSNTTGAGNAASGYLALFRNISGSTNTATGAAALYRNTSGSRNTATGYRALYSNSIGDNNTASGSRALYANTTGSHNTASGYKALRFNSTGVMNTASGTRALYSNTSGAQNTASGSEALLRNTTGDNNTASGFRALQFNDIGRANTAMGVMALYANTSGNNNVATGTKTLEANTTGSNNTVSGYRALSLNTTGSSNSASGYKVLFSNTSGHSNVASGDRALLYNTTGYGNIANGAEAMRSNTSGNLNTATGYRALYSNTTGMFNNAIGFRSLFSNTSGVFNNAIGEGSLFTNTTGIRNTACGMRALYRNTTGSRNSAVGDGAVFNNTTGFYNVGIGYRVLFSNTTGAHNIAIGDSAGTNLTIGSNNIAIGNAGVAGDGATTRIGTAGTHTRAFIAGIRGVTTVNANAIPVLIDSTGQLGTVSSSRRFKQDIVDMGDATENLLELRPVRFRYKQEQMLPDGSEVPMEYGLIAEEVAEVFPDLVVYGDDGKPFTVKYHILASMLLNEMKKEKALHARELEAQANVNAEQQAELVRMRELAARNEAQSHDLEQVQREFAQQRCELERLHGLEARLAALEARTASATLPATNSSGDR